MSEINYAAELDILGAKARKAAREMAKLSTLRKNKILEAIACALSEAEDRIREANQKDLVAAEANGLSASMLDRLTLTPERIADMVKGLRDVASFNDPIGRVDSDFIRPNGLHIEKRRVAIGVIGIIYESRPNVTIDSAALCLKAGNTVMLRGGKEAFHSNQVLVDILSEAGSQAGLPDSAVQLLPWTDREAIYSFVRLDKYLQLVIPRGGEGLIRYVAENATVPVIKHYKGVCHVYVDSAADVEMAGEIIRNAKVQRPGVCNAMECVVVHADVAEALFATLAEKIPEVTIRGDKRTCELLPTATPADESDWGKEYLELTMASRVVADLDEALDFIDLYSSHHSDAIVTNDKQVANRFREEVDSAAVYVNASTRFTDGSVFGMGAEIGISTDRLHARGPMGLEELTTYKYVINGKGQIR